MLPVYKKLIKKNYRNWQYFFKTECIIYDDLGHSLVCIHWKCIHLCDKRYAQRMFTAALLLIAK